MERRFATVQVEEPTAEDALAILKGLRPKYEEHHHVKIDDEALKAAVKLSTRYLTSRFLPDKAIDLMDEAAAMVRIEAEEQSSPLANEQAQLRKLGEEKERAIEQQDFDRAAQLRQAELTIKARLAQEEEQRQKQADQYQLHVTGEDIAKVVAEWTGVPLTQLQKTESDRLINLERVLHQRVIGQDEAVSAIARSIRRARSGLKDPNRPIGSFMFLGPTGVGKTELAKALAEAMFGSENNMIRVDMSEYMENTASVA